MTQKHLLTIQNKQMITIRTRALIEIHIYQSNNLFSIIQIMTASTIPDTKIPPLSTIISKTNSARMMLWARTRGGQTMALLESDRNSMTTSKR